MDVKHMNTDRLLARVETAAPSDGLQRKIENARRQNKQLVVKLGFDPTAPDLHFGHAVVLKKLRDFQDEGHRVVVIIGDFTASIGDPTGRNAARPPLSSEQIEENCHTYLNQLGKIVDTVNLEVKYNSQWHNNIDLRKMISIVSNVTIAQIMARDDFSARFSSQRPIHMHELLYPILQGYDLVMIKADVELGGTDQLFNCLMGRTLQQIFGQEGQIVLVLPLLIGTDGIEKMSKSRNNYIGLTEDPVSVYGKAMSIPDLLIQDYLSLATDLEAERQNELVCSLRNGENPMSVKKVVAYSMVRWLYDTEQADEAAAHFERTVQNRTVFDEDHERRSLTLAIEDLGPTTALLNVCHWFSPEKTRSQIRRLIEGGGVRVDGAKVTDPHQPINLVGNLRLWMGRRTRYLLE